MHALPPVVEDAITALHEAGYRSTAIELEALFEERTETQPDDSDLLTIAYMSGQHDGRKEAQQPPAEAQRCTCPSGDGSLRWPCPAHPPEAQPVAWSTVKPSRPGVYGVRGFNSCREPEDQFEAIVSVRRHEGDLICNLHEYTSEEDFDRWIRVDDCDDRFEWCEFVAAHPPPSAPVGVDAAMVERALNTYFAEQNQLVDKDPKLFRAMRAALTDALAQQSAFILPDVDDDDLTVAYMAGRHDGRKEAQQPAACTRCGGEGEVASTDPYAETEPCPECKPNQQLAVVDEVKCPWDGGSPCVEPMPAGMVYPKKPAPRAGGYLDTSGVEWNAWDAGQMEAYARTAYSDGWEAGYRAALAAQQGGSNNE